MLVCASPSAHTNGSFWIENFPHSGGGAAADITAWAEFHNGAASGLRMAAEHGTGTSGIACMHASCLGVQELMICSCDVLCHIAHMPGI